MDTATARAVHAFMRRLEGHYRVHEAILFGSRARRDHGPVSDADLAIVLEETHGNRSAAVKDMAAVAFHVMLETGIMVEAMPFWREEFEQPDSYVNPALIRNILREGVRL